MICPECSHVAPKLVLWVGCRTSACQEGFQPRYSMLHPSSQAVKSSGDQEEVEY